MRPIISTLRLALGCFAAKALAAAELKQETSNAFSRYIVLTEERMARSLHGGDSFYSMGGKPELQREGLRIRLRRGEIIIDQMETLEAHLPGSRSRHFCAIKSASAHRSGPTSVSAIGPQPMKAMRLESGRRAIHRCFLGWIS